MVGERNLRAVADVTGALPLMFAGTPEITDIGALLDAVDGILLTGARANVHPTRFGARAARRGTSPTTTTATRWRSTLVEACVARGVPLFGICRGFQEMSVAFGCSLHPEIRELPGRMNHRMPRLENGEIHPDPLVIFADRHDVTLVPDGAFAKILGCETIRVNSLHGQGIDVPGKRVVVEGVAEDGTIEAIRIDDAPGFALGVQWHAEYDPQQNPVNRKLFEAFGAALGAQARLASDGFSPLPARTPPARFELDVDGHIAFANYRNIDGVIAITHTEVPARVARARRRLAPRAGDARRHPRAESEGAAALLVCALRDRAASRVRRSGGAVDGVGPFRVPRAAAVA